MVDYTGKRDLETMSKFLDNGGVLPPAESQEEEDFDDEDDDTGDEVCVFYCHSICFSLFYGFNRQSLILLSSSSVSQEAPDSAEVPTNTTSKDEL